MGKKGDKLTAASAEAAKQLTQAVADLGDIHVRKMFGGHGVFEAGTMFALIDSAGGIFFKVDESIQAKYEQAGASKHGRMPYYAVPDSVLQNEETLQEWALASIQISK